MSRFHIGDHLLNVVGEVAEIGEHVGASFHHFLKSFFLASGNSLALLQRNTRVPALDVYVAIAEQTFGNEDGGGIGEDVLLKGLVQTQTDFDAFHAVGRLAGFVGNEADEIHVANFNAVEAHWRACGKALHFGKICFQAVFWAEGAGAGDVKDGDAKNEESDKNEKANAQLGPGQLFALGHPQRPPWLGRCPANYTGIAAGILMREWKK